MATTTAVEHCIFCDIVRGAAEVSICYEDGIALAFMDIQPVNMGHVLVVPRDHFETLPEVPRTVGAHLFQVVSQLIPAVQQVSGVEDMNIIVNSGAAAGQDVNHFHIHLIPRRAGDGFAVELPFPRSEMPYRHLLDAYAARISAGLRNPLRKASP